MRNKMAHVINNTAAIREQSHNPETGKYVLSLKESAKRACNQSRLDAYFAPLISNLLIHSYEETLDWAKAVLSKDTTYMKGIMK